MILFLFFFYILCSIRFFFFFFNDTATTEIYTLSLHDALPICEKYLDGKKPEYSPVVSEIVVSYNGTIAERSEEHTSELQSRLHLVCRLLLEKKKKIKSIILCFHFNI